MFQIKQTLTPDDPAIIFYTHGTAIRITQIFNFQGGTQKLIRATRHNETFIIQATHEEKPTPNAIFYKGGAGRITELTIWSERTTDTVAIFDGRRGPLTEAWQKRPTTAAAKALTALINDLCNNPPNP